MTIASAFSNGETANSSNNALAGACGPPEDRACQIGTVRQPSAEVCRNILRQPISSRKKHELSPRQP